MANFIKSYQANVGLNHVPAYQVSGQPFASGSIDTTTATKVSFPYVTRWFKVVNNGTAEVKIGFSENGLNGTNFFTVQGISGNEQNQTELLEIKVSELWLSGSNSVDVVAGLTSIPASRTTTDSGTSWSGSSGVG